MSQKSYPSCAEVPFQNVAFFLQKCLEAQRRKTKLQHLKRFQATFPRHDCFQIYRLLLPHLDTMERQMYQLKEKKLGIALSKACGHDPKTSKAAKKVIDFKSSGTKSITAGDFAKSAEEYLFKGACKFQDGSPGSSTLKVGELNEWLDHLAQSDAMADKEKVLNELVMRTTPNQMKWIVCIILKDIKIGIKERIILGNYHPDAEALNNLSSNLKRVCEELKDPNHRMPRKEVEPGSSIRPQLASVASNPTSAFKKMAGRDFVVEVKFDGERMQLHREGTKIQFFSRRGREHADLSGYEVFTNMVPKQLKWEKCILDGEICVRNKTTQKFEPFGGIRSVVAAIKSGANPGDVLEMKSAPEGGAVLTADPNYTAPQMKDLEIVYVAFDILYADDTSLTNLPLKERHQHLKNAISAPDPKGYPIPGAEHVTTKIIPLLPGVLYPGMGVLSRVGSTQEVIQEMYDQVTADALEGIVIKAMTEPWLMNNRSDSWLKMKPDYVTGMDIDALIIGASFGTGSRGGGLSEFLLALGETPRMANAEPSTFVSFCRVGTGVNFNQLNELREKLKNNLRNVPAKCVKLCGAPREKMDLWVGNPLESVVLKVKGDMRMITSRQFASSVSLRFPRIMEVRWDKPAVQCSTEKEVQEAAQQGIYQGVQEESEDTQAHKKRKTGAAGNKYPAVAAQFRPADVSGVQTEFDLLCGAPVCFLTYDSKGKDYWHKVVKRLGGDIHMNPIKQYSVTDNPTGNTVVETKYVLAARHDFEKNYKVQAKVKADQFDIIFLDWLEECEREGELMEPTPRHYIHIATHHLQDDPWHFDAHGDMPLVDSTPEDIQAIFERHMRHYSLRAARTAADALMKSAARRAEAEWEEGGDDDVAVGDVEVDVCRQLLTGSLDPSLCLFQGARMLFLYVPTKKDMYSHLMAPGVIPGLESSDDEARAGEEGTFNKANRGAGGTIIGRGHENNDGGDAGRRVVSEQEMAVLEGVDDWLREQHEQVESAGRQCMKSLQLQVAARGGIIVNIPERGLTHLVLYHSGSDPSPVKPYEVLKLLKDLGAPPKRLQGLRRGLEKRTILVVNAKWVEDSLDTAVTERVRALSEVSYPPNILGFQPDLLPGDQDTPSPSGDPRAHGQEHTDDVRTPVKLVVGRPAGGREPVSSAGRLSQDRRSQFDEWPWEEFGIASLAGSVSQPSSDDDGTKAAESSKKEKGKRKRAGRGKGEASAEGSTKKPARPPRKAAAKPAGPKVRGGGAKLAAARTTATEQASGNNGDELEGGVDEGVLETVEEVEGGDISVQGTSERRRRKRRDLEDEESTHDTPEVVKKSGRGAGKGGRGRGRRGRAAEEDVVLDGVTELVEEPKKQPRRSRKAAVVISDSEVEVEVEDEEGARCISGVEAEVDEEEEERQGHNKSENERNDNIDDIPGLAVAGVDHPQRLVSTLPHVSDVPRVSAALSSNDIGQNEASRMFEHGPEQRAPPAADYKPSQPAGRTTSYSTLLSRMFNTMAGMTPSNPPIPPTTQLSLPVSKMQADEAQCANTSVDTAPPIARLPSATMHTASSHATLGRQQRRDENTDKATGEAATAVAEREPSGEASAGGTAGMIGPKSSLHALLASTLDGSKPQGYTGGLTAMEVETGRRRSMPVLDPVGSAQVTSLGIGHVDGQCARDEVGVPLAVPVGEVVGASMTARVLLGAGSAGVPGGGAVQTIGSEAQETGLVSQGIAPKKKSIRSRALELLKKE